LTLETTAQNQTDYITMLEEALCDGCRPCLPVCSHGALIWVRGDETLLTDSWACTGCGTCVTTCPTGAFSLVPRRRS
jgi:MinD superfamily P-loop ATPase